METFGVWKHSFPGFTNEGTHAHAAQQKQKKTHKQKQKNPHKQTHFKYVKQSLAKFASHAHF